MFWSLFSDELSRRLRSWVPWLLMVVLVCYTASALLGADTSDLGGGGVPHNGSFVIYYWGMYSAFWVAVLGPLLMAAPLLRDIRTKMAPLVYTTPISKEGYFWGKYMAGMVITVMVMMSVPVTIIVIPWIAHALGGGQMFGHFTLWNHIGWTTVIWVLPACFIYGSIHFALAARSSRLLFCYGFALLSMAVFTLFFVSFKASAGHHTWVELIDPIGKQTLDAQALFWSMPERTAHFLSPSMILISNRILWITIGAIFLIWGAASFRLEDMLNKGRKSSPSSSHRKHTPRQLLYIKSDSRLGLLLHLASIHWSATIRLPVFRVIVAALVVLGLTSAWGAESAYALPENQMRPYAQYLFTVVQPSLYMILAMAMIYFAGEIAARDRESKMLSLISATSVPGNVLIGGRLIAIMYMALLFSLLPSLSIIIFQFSNGFLETEPQHFIRSILLHLFLPLIEFGALTLALDLLTHKKLFAQGLPLILLWGGIAMHETGTINERLALFGVPQPMIFSAFSVLDADTWRHLLYAAWWLGIVGIIVVLASHIDLRGEQKPLYIRIRHITIKWPALTSIAAMLIVTLTAGATIHRNLYEVNDTQSLQEDYRDQALYEQLYGQWRNQPRPLITEMALATSVNPAKGLLTTQGKWTVSNPDSNPITAILVNIPENSRLKLANKSLGLSLRHDDHRERVQIYRFDHPLAAGEKTTIDFTLHSRWQGFVDGAFAWPIGRNVVILDNNAFPRLNYDRKRELAETNERFRHHLPSRPLPVDDPSRSALNDSAGRVAIDIKISAPSDFRLYTSGISSTEQIHDGQHILEVKADNAPLDPLIIAVKGVEKKQLLWRHPKSAPIPISFTFRKNHGQALDSISKETLLVLDHLARRFGSPPFQALNIVETPQFIDEEALAEARSSGSLLYIPERRGWLHDMRRPQARAYLTFTLGREMGRSWYHARFLAPSSPHAMAMEEGFPIALGLEAVATQYDQKTTSDFLGILQEKQQKMKAASKILPRNPSDITDQPYAALQTGLDLFYRWHPDFKIDSNNHKN
ncbi:ABC transporter permease [Zymomonas mobilis]|uniref:ABC transporter permease n=1 Tax=Zymomonas mobilis TaxID=542 RepID=UPI00242A6D2C|nr:ABC transporter permease [Zymomonas mobilis]